MTGARRTRQPFWQWPMSYVYAGEAGNFDVLTTCRRNPLLRPHYRDARSGIIGPAVTNLRYDSHGEDSRWTLFHATSDEQAVRDELFRCLDPLPLRIDATILETEQKLYQMA
jgi:hypothetical protein